MIEKRHRVVLDTNVLVSSALRPGSLPDQVVEQAALLDTVLVSNATLAEIDEVFSRPKFNRATLTGLRHDLRAKYAERFMLVTITEQVTDCRDAKDNKFLDLALSGKADFIITGDADLLALHPWRGIGILSPADYLALSE